MRIVREAYETAIAAGKESEVPLLLVGDHGIITDVMVVPISDFTEWLTDRLMYIKMTGGCRYGKVITKNDNSLEPGFNFIEENGRWQFLDMDGNEVEVEVIEGAPRKEDDVEELIR